MNIQAMLNIKEVYIKKLFLANKSLYFLFFASVIFFKNTLYIRLFTVMIVWKQFRNLNRK